MVWANNLPNLDYGLDQTMPNIDELEALAGTKNSNNSELIQSGILDSLNMSIKQIENDYHETMYPEYTDDIIINKKIKEKIENYYKIRVYAQATEICDHIDGLIQLDRYPKEMFGQYKTLRMLLQKINDNQEKVRCLMQLKIIAKSIIPVEIKYETKEVIEPSLISASQTMEG